MVSRGQVWWAELPNPIGSEPGFTRPVLVIQADEVEMAREYLSSGFNLSVQIQRG